jgi:cell division septation protein DedD
MNGAPHAAPEDVSPHERARLRRELLYRAALATGLMVLLVIGLTIYDEAPAPPPAADAPLPVTRAPVVTGAPDAASAPPADAAADHETAVPAPQARDPVAGADDPCVAKPDAGDEPGDAEAPYGEAANAAHAADAAQRAVAPADLPPAAQHDPLPPPDRPASGDGDAAAVVAAPSPPPQAARSVAQRSVGAPASAVPPSASGRYQLQIGRFADVEAAARLRDELAGDGHAASVLTRVAVGPFAERRAAQDVLARLRRERALRGVLVAATAGGGHLVQVGVFANRGNAERLRGELAGAGYPVVTDARVVVGPYAQRGDADAALAVLRGARGLEAAIVALP